MILEVQKVSFQEFLNLSSSQRNMSGPIIRDRGVFLVIAVDFAMKRNEIILSGQNELIFRKDESFLIRIYWI
jgi:hypothetical protein